MTLSLVHRSLLEKLAADNGFDVHGPQVGDWAEFSSTQVPLRVWMSSAEAGYRLAVSQQGVADELASLTQASGVELPPGAVAVREVAGLTPLYNAVRRAYQLSGTLPTALLDVFLRHTQGLPQETEVERLAVQRLGQGIFRDGLLRYWEGQCAVTGLAEPELLRASHIKPWADCDTDAERLDVWNGLLLAPHLDAAFDQGFITVADDGEVLVSGQLGAEDRALLGLDRVLRVERLMDGHRGYLGWHRKNRFKGSSALSR